MEEPLFISPKLNNFLPDLVFPQNLPSCICAHVLDPQPGETVLDMCAAPGLLLCYFLAEFAIVEFELITVGSF